MTATPEHVLWAIERECPFRIANNWTDPEQTARELRSLRAYSDAVSDGRVIDGLCLDRLPADRSANAAVRAFPVSEVFDTLGDERVLTQTCGNCVANIPSDQPAGLAGCHGLLEVADLKLIVNEVCARTGSSGLFPSRSVTQGFYGLWFKSPWRGEKVVAAIELFEEVDRQAQCQLLTFIAALRQVRLHDLSIHVKLMPRGEVKGQYWHVVQHCPICRAEWTSESRRCQVCDYRGTAVPTRRRHARGNRPFLCVQRSL